MAHFQALFLVAIIKWDVVWAGSPVPLPMLATWSQSNLYLAEVPCDEGDLMHLLGLMVHNLTELIAPAPALSAASAPVHIAPELAATYSAPAPVVERLTLATAVYAAPAPATEASVVVYIALLP